MQAKVEQAWEADKLAKRNAGPPETAVHDVSTALQRRKAAQAKEQAKLVELEAAAKAAVEAVEEAKQKAIKRQEDIDRLQAEKRTGAGMPGSILGLCHTSSKVPTRRVPDPFWLC